MIVFGIETSCDETSVCILKEKEILSMKTFSQIDLHKFYGGVVPEIASRSHMEVISQLAAECFEEAGLRSSQIDVIAVTREPGLIGALLVGLNFAKGMSMALNKPIIYVNHLEGHIFTVSLKDNIENQFYCLLVSGGHTQTLEVESLWDYKLTGETIDDSAGESFDKLSKKLGFGYPGGSIIEELAKKGYENRFTTKIPLKGKHKFNFSFSGLKTHFLNLCHKHTNEKDVFDIAASFQKTVCDVLIDRTRNMILASTKKFQKIVICGGVSANLYIRKKFDTEFPEYAIYYAPIALCTDNAAMIANIGRMRFCKGEGKLI